MTATWQTVVDSFNSLHNDAADKALAYGARSLCMALSQMRKQNATKTINLAINDDRYDLGDDVVAVLYVHHYATATDILVLEETTIERLDLEDDAWRLDTSSDAGRPAKYAIEGVTDGAKSAKAELVFRPIPGTAFGGTYPHVKVGYVKYEVPVAGTVIPPFFSDFEVLKAGMEWCYAGEYLSKEEKALAWDDFQFQIDRQIAHARRMTPGVKKTYLPKGFGGRPLV